MRRLVSLAAVLMWLALFGCENSGESHASRIFYVSVETGNDANSGSTAVLPKQSIHAALSIARSGDEIRVAAGDYLITSDLTDKTYPSELQLVSGVAVLGGYDANFSQRDPAQFITSIINVGATGANRIFVAADRVDHNTVIDGFTLDGGDSTGGSRVIFIENGSPTISNNVIHAGFGADSVGIWIDYGVVRIRNNIIDRAHIGILYKGGDDPVEFNVISGNTVTVQRDGVNSGNTVQALNISGGKVVVQNNTFAALGDPNAADAPGGDIQAVYITDALNADVTFTGNTVSAGYTKNPLAETSGLYVLKGKILAYNNVFFGGAGGKTSAAIHIEQGKSTFWNNTVVAGTGTQAHGLSIDNAIFSSAAEIEFINSIFYGGTACIHEVGGAPKTLQNNNFFACTHIYEDDDAACAGDIDGDGNPKTCALEEVIGTQDIANAATGNIELDPTFTNMNGADGILSTIEDNDWRLQFVTPLAVREGGLDLSLQFDKVTDKSGADRTTVLSGTSLGPYAAGWSIGAYEFDLF